MGKNNREETLTPSSTRATTPVADPPEKAQISLRAFLQLQLITRDEHKGRVELVAG